MAPGAAGGEPRLDLAAREGHEGWQSRSVGTDGEGDHRAGVDSDMVKGYPGARSQTLQVNALEGLHLQSNNVSPKLIVMVACVCAQASTDNPDVSSVVSRCLEREYGVASEEMLG